jgi:hypothetical protein
MKLQRSFFYLGFFAISIATRTDREGLPGGLWLCNQPNWKGNCTWYPPFNECRTLATSNLDERPNSAGPDWGGYCVFFQHEDCRGDIVEVLPGNL